jgi:prolyl oligopeptidase
MSKIGMLDYREAASRSMPDVPPPPDARVDVVEDCYFGERVRDPYRWLENDRDPGWLPFLRAQNYHTRAVLDSLPVLPALRRRIAEISSEIATTTQVQRCGDDIFYLQQPRGASNFMLFLRTQGQDFLLIDPTETGAQVSIDWWRASPDGKHVVYGLSLDGSEDSVLHILSVAAGKKLPEQIPGTQCADPHWLDDGSGFFYTQLTGKVDTPERFLDSQARFHRLGTDPEKDPIVMRRGLLPDVTFERIQMPVVRTDPGASHAVLLLSDVRQEMRVLVAPVADAAAGTARWVDVAGFEHEVTQVEIANGMLCMLAHRGHPRGHVIQTPVAAPDLLTATEIVPQGALVIEGIAPARDGLYLRMMDGGLSRLFRVRGGAPAEELALPFDAAIGRLFGDAMHDGVLMTLSGRLQPTGVWAAAADGRVRDLGINPKPNVDVSAIETRRLFATAGDGTQIPYTLLLRRGMQLDGNNPAFISAYGAYGATPYVPNFAGRTLALIEAGMVVGYAHVRGGGEFGREWHKGGQGENKPNTWRDLIAVCEDACARGYTKPARLAIGGRSAGGIAVGRAMTERPDLFAAVVSAVSWSNPLRYVVEQNSFSEEPEWGAISEEAGYRALKGMDSYQALREGTPYPAVLLTTGVKDPRVAPFHAAKMAARLQATTSSGKPVLLRVEFEGGHGMGATCEQQDMEAADTFAFLLWQTQ